ncbi:MAG: hypothetical protein P4M11_12610 [Candidatus Pacebacteria bacterium]|nr:hypothetical protein [Candidatus Paceibacterota bacterium]
MKSADTGRNLEKQQFDEIKADRVIEVVDKPRVHAVYVTLVFTALLNLVPIEAG